MKELTEKQVAELFRLASTSKNGGIYHISDVIMAGILTTGMEGNIELDGGNLYLRYRSGESTGQRDLVDLVYSPEGEEERMPYICSQKRVLKDDILSWLTRFGGPFTIVDGEERKKTSYRERMVPKPEFVGKMWSNLLQVIDKESLYTATYQIFQPWKHLKIWEDR